MTTVQRWTGRESRALRHALRMSIRDFADHLGVSERTVSKWEAGQSEVCPRPEMQAALDTALAHAQGDAERRFNSILGISGATESRGNPGQQQDPAALARQQVAQARHTLGLTPEGLAEVLAPILRWKPTSQMVSSWETTVVPPGDVVVGIGLVLGNAPIGCTDHGTNAGAQLPADRFADVTAIYRNRAELSTHLSCEKLLEGAHEVRAAGLSLNLLCQHYADHRWRELIESGAQVRCLFLDPDGSAMQAREIEEGFPTGHLTALTKLNIETLLRVRDRLPDDLRGGIAVATHDETIRFNIIIVDDLCITQPYLPDSRGVDAPALVMRRGHPAAGLYPVFEQVFNSQWERGRVL